MQITDLLAQAGGLRSLAAQLGIDEKQAAAGAEALLPAILGGFRKQAQQAPSGLGGLGDLLGQLGGGGLLEQVLAPQPADVRQGDRVLGEIFGSKDVSRAVAQDAAARTGLDASLLKKMLPLLAMLVTGMLAKNAGAGTQAPSNQGGLGGLAGALGGLLGGGRGAAAAGGLGGLGGLAAMLDADGNGNPLDDILRMVAKR